MQILFADNKNGFEMISQDKLLLSLKFQKRILSYSGFEFQHFVENIFEKTYPDFEKVKLDGRKGDGGNDGFRKTEGIYYAMYSPESPEKKSKSSSEKIVSDFNKLIRSRWRYVAQIKEYHFVFNDHFRGISQDLHLAKVELQKKWPGIKFELVLAKDIEKIFLELKEDNLRILGFDLEERITFTFSREILLKIETLLFREDTMSASKLFNTVDEIIQELKSPSITIELELLRCKLQLREEKIEEAKENFNKIIKDFPSDPRAYIFLADILFQEEDDSKGSALLKKVEQFDEESDYFKLGQLCRDLKFTPLSSELIVNESKFPENPFLRSDFYRLYGLWFLKYGEFENATRFIDESLKIAPSKLQNRIAKIKLLIDIWTNCKDEGENKNQLDILIDYIREVKEDFHSFAGTSLRAQVIVAELERQVILGMDDVEYLRDHSEHLIGLAIQCHFDKQIEEILSSTLEQVQINDKLFDNLRRKLISVGKPIGANLRNSIVLHLNLRGISLSEARYFFDLLSNNETAKILGAIEISEYVSVIEMLSGNTPLGIILAATLKGHPSLRKKIVVEVLEETYKHKDFLLLMICIEEDDLDVAYEMIKQINLSDLNPLQLYQIEEVVHRKNAWETDVNILSILLSEEKKEIYRFTLKRKLLIAQGRLKNYKEVIKLGKELLDQNKNQKILDDVNTEHLLGDTIFALMNRQTLDPSLLSEAINLLKEYEPTNSSFEFKVGIKAQLYVLNSDFSLGIKAIIEAFKSKRWLEASDYTSIYAILLELSTRSDFNLDSLEFVENENFVKLDASFDWFYCGVGDNLDAIKVEPNDILYSNLMGHQKGDRILISPEFRTSPIVSNIEFIFPIEKYIFWKVREKIDKLTDISSVPGLTKIDTPIEGGELDLSSLQQYFETMNSKSMPFFEEYVQSPLPFALLAVSEGSLESAIGRIQREKSGFINATTGSLEDFERQKKLIRRLLIEKTAFYIDGTSAYILSRLGILSLIKEHISNIKLPQSVVDFLIRLTNQYKESPGRAGYLAYINGEITFSEIDTKFQAQIMKQLVDIITFFESEENRIDAISPANKLNCDSETKVPSELCDACILAQQDNLPIMTEDYFYLQFNQIETGKKQPEYFSIIPFIRVLYEDGILTTDTYFECFEFLAFHRFKFIHLNPDDLQETVFGKDKIKSCRPKNIQKLNLRLLLSEEYGTNFMHALIILTKFLSDLLNDPSIIEEILRDIFVEVLEALPVDRDKYYVGNLMLAFCRRKIKDQRNASLVITNTSTIESKISKLEEIVKIYKNTSKVIISDLNFSFLKYSS
jgi:hypothetical protein